MDTFIIIIAACVVLFIENRYLYISKKRMETPATKKVEYMNTSETTIVICTRCNGEGQIPFATGDDRIYEYKTCMECGGFGMVKKTVTIQFEKLQSHPKIQLKNENNGFEQI